MQLVIDVQDKRAEWLLTFMALSRSVSCSRLLKQLLQLQLLQNSPFAKQSQYLRNETIQIVISQNYWIEFNLIMNNRNHISLHKKLVVHLEDTLSNHL